MTHFVRLSALAEEDILRNALWWADHHSADEAIYWESVVRQQLREIANNPDSHGLSGESSLMNGIFRDALLGTGRRGSYRAVFIVSGDMIFIMRVLRASQGAFRAKDLPKESN